MSAQTILPTPELVYIGTPPIPLNLPSPLPHRVRGWVAEVADLTAPDGIQWCDGSAAELELLADLEMFSRATATTPDEPPPWGATHQDLSVGGAGSGSRVVSCSLHRRDAPPSDLWAEPELMRRTLRRLFSGAMRGRTMYVAPYTTDPDDGRASTLGIEVTDSPLVVVNLSRINRIGRPALRRIQAGEHWASSVHSVGYPLMDAAGTRRPDVPWPCNPEKWIADFPDTDDAWSFGTGFGATALLG